MADSASDSLFPLTDWTLIRVLQSADSPAAAIALDLLCRSYCRPLYVCARASGLSPHDAEDAVQDFMAHALGNNAFATLDQKKGRLRGWMTTAFRHRRSERVTRQAALKRGGGHEHVPLDTAAAEQLFLAQHYGDPSAEHACDLRMALDVWSVAQQRLDADRSLQKRPLIYAQLRPHILTGWPADGRSQAEVAHELGISVGTLRVRLYNLIKKAGDTFQQVARETLDPCIPPDDVEYLWQLLKQS